MTRKKTAEAPMDTPAEGKISKSEAVRRALADGVEQPTDGVAYIKDNFGLDMKPQHFSAVKSGHLKKRGGGQGDGIKVKFKRAKKAESAAPSSGEADLLAAMEAMKPLVASLGAEKVKRIVDLLG